MHYIESGFRIYFIGMAPRTLAAENSADKLTECMTALSPFVTRKDRIISLQLLLTLSQNARTAELICVGALEDILRLTSQTTSTTTSTPTSTASTAIEDDDQNTESVLAMSLLSKLSISEINKKAMLQGNALSIVMTVLQLTGHTEIRRCGAEILSELSLCGSSVIHEIKTLKGFDLLADILHSTHEDVVEAALRAIWHIALQAEDTDRIVFRKNTALNRILRLEKHPSSSTISTLAQECLQALSLTPEIQRYIQQHPVTL